MNLVDRFFKNFAVFLNYKAPVIKCVLVGRTVAMVTYCGTKMRPACPPIIGQFFDTVHGKVIKNGYKDRSKSNRWKVL